VGKQKHLLIANFLSNLSVKNCQNLCVKVIARQISDIFETQLNPVYTTQPVVKPVVKSGLTTG